MQLADFTRYIRGFLHLAIPLDAFNLSLRSLLPAEGDELLRETLLIFLNQDIREGDNPARRTVIGIHMDHTAPGEVLVKIQHDVRPCPTERVDGLVVITYYTQVPGRPGKEVQDVPLHIVGILVLVTLDVREPPLVFRKDPVVVLQQLFAFNQHVVHIIGMVLCLPVCVSVIDLAEDFRLAGLRLI